MLIYMGAPIDASKENPKVNFSILSKCIKKAKNQFDLDHKDFNVNVFNPCGAFADSIFPDTDKIKSKKEVLYDYNSIKSVNDSIINTSDIAVFLVDDNVSYGVPYEIKLCSDEGIDCIVYFKSSRSVPIYLMNMVNNDKFRIVFDEDELVKVLSGRYKSTLGNRVEICKNKK